MELRGQEEHTATATAFLLSGRLLWCSSLSHRLNCAAAKFVSQKILATTVTAVKSIFMNDQASIKCEPASMGKRQQNAAAAQARAARRTRTVPPSVSTGAAPTQKHRESFYILLSQTTHERFDHTGVSNRW